MLAACRAQYSAVRHSPFHQSPVTFEIKGNRGGRIGISAATNLSSSSIGAIKGEWNACETVSGRTS